MKKKTYNSNWVLTDSDTQQYGRQINDKLFEFKESRSTGGPEDPTEVYQAGIDLGGFTNKEVEDVINSYGYTMHKGHKTLSNVFARYGDQANWIIAECMFETVG